jgi:hypothetical protein
MSRAYYDFFVYRYDRHCIAPYIKKKKVVYSTWNVKDLKNFRKETERKFKNESGTFLFKNKFNRAVCKFTMLEGKVTVMFKTNVRGNLYLLWKTWMTGRTFYKILDLK